MYTDMYVMCNHTLSIHIIYTPLDTNLVASFKFVMCSSVHTLNMHTYVCVPLYTCYIVYLQLHT